MSYTFQEYQRDARSTVAYPTIGHPVIYPLLGLAGEAGEVSEKLKKIFRDRGGVITDEDRLMITKELGDVLWYVSQIASELDISLETVATHNRDKLASRKDRGVIGGSGDER